MKSCLVTKKKKFTSFCNFFGTARSSFIWCTCTTRSWSYLIPQNTLSTLIKGFTHSIGYFKVLCNHLCFLYQKFWEVQRRLFLQSFICYTLFLFSQKEIQAKQILSGLHVILASGISLALPCHPNCGHVITSHINSYINAINSFFKARALN